MPSPSPVTKVRERVVRFGVISRLLRPKRVSHIDATTGPNWLPDMTLMVEPAELVLVGDVEQTKGAHADGEQIDFDQTPDGTQAKGQEHRGHVPGVVAHVLGATREGVPEQAHE